MFNSIRLFLLLFSVVLMTACDQNKSTEISASDTPTTEESLSDDIIDSENVNSDDNESASTDDNCGSLKPLLRLLPGTAQVGGLPETFRGCENSSEQTVSVIYANEGDEYTEYLFKIYVLDSESNFAKSNLKVDGATEEQQSYINKTFKTTGDIRKTILDTCRRYHQSPLIPDGRNPLIVQVKGIDVCVMDNLDANKEIWNAFAIKGDLEFRLEFSGYKAGKIITTESARDHLIPLFEQFLLNENP